MKDLEVICIDDGSTDSSPQIIERIQAEDERVVLFHQENQGAGVARNVGIRRAQGKYIAFLDADDYYVDPMALEIMFDVCETQKVSVCASRNMYRIEDEREYISELFAKETSNKILRYEDYQSDYNYQSYLFLKKILIENNIFFPLYRRFQDPPFLVNVSYIAKKFAVADICLYAYRVSEVSARYNADKVCDLLQGLIDNLNFAKQHGLDILFRNTVERLEYEFAYVIYKNISIDDLRILKLLMKANQIIIDKCGLSDYIIRPIRIIALYRSYEEKLFQRIEDQQEIALYGAGKLTKTFLGYLKKKNLLKRVTTIVVSDLEGNVSQIDKIPVISLKEFVEKKNCFLLITVGNKIAKEIETSLKQIGYTNYQLLDNSFGEEIVMR
jgi:Glycosyltransferases involved in cell wall biogenesis